MKEWIVVIVVLAMVGIVYFRVVEATKPTCPTFAATTFTRNGWYCTVPPLRNE